VSLTSGIKRRLRKAVPKSWKAYRNRLAHRLADAYEAASWFHLTIFLFYGVNIDPAYGLTWRKRLALARRMRKNTTKVETGMSYRGHLAIASKVFSVPKSVPGVIVEAGCWKGGTTANLSLIAKAAGRQLIVYDSFEGLPPAVEGDHWSSDMGEGAFKGELEEVKANVARLGDIEVCEFRKGWFSDTMGDHTEPIVLAYVDVDYQSSFHDCMLGLWPYLNDDGYMFIDEYTRLDYCALFFSERYWRTYFDRPPPGLMGAGSGVGIGQIFIGPLRNQRPLERTGTVAWTRKDFYAEWDYEPNDLPFEPLPGGKGAKYGREGWTLTTQSMEEHEAELISKLVKTDPEVRRMVEEHIASALETEEGKAALEAKLSTPDGIAALEAYLATTEGQEKVAAALGASEDGSGPADEGAEQAEG
jgi:O-methyltransferase